jgi:hypothetical protein
MPSGKQIKRLVERRCAELGLTMTEANKLMGRNASWLYDVFDSKRVQTKTIHHLAEKLQVDVGYFFADDYLKNSGVRKGKR